jgi:hypothetical protein
MKWNFDYNDNDFKVVVDTNYRRDYSNNEKNYNKYIIEFLIPRIKYERECYQIVGLSDKQAMLKVVDDWIDLEKRFFDFYMKEESFLKRIKTKREFKNKMKFFEGVKKII